MKLVFLHITILDSYLIHRPSKLLLIKHREPAKKPEPLIYNYFINRPIANDPLPKNTDGGLASALGALSALTGAATGGASGGGGGFGAGNGGGGGDSGGGGGRGGRGGSEDGESGGRGRGRPSAAASGGGDDAAVVDSTAIRPRTGEPLFELIYFVCSKLNAINTLVDLNMCYSNLYNILHIKQQI